MSTIERKLISTVNAAKPQAPYNQAIVVDRLVYVSGCLGLDKDSLTIVPGGSGPEMAKTLENMKAILEAAGSCIENVIKVVIFVDDLNDFAVINEEYNKVFVKDFPARTCVQIVKIGLNAKVEVEAIALIGDVKTVRHYDQ